MYFKTTDIPYINHEKFYKNMDYYLPLTVNTKKLITPLIPARL